MASRTLALAAVLPLLAGCLGGFLGGVTPGDYLSSKTYTKWVVEVDYASGHRPSQDLLNFMKGRLESVADKPGGITFLLDESLPAESRTWGSDVVDYAARHQGHKTGGDTVVTHLLFLAGGSDDDSDNRKVLGETWGRSPIILFDEAVKGLCSPLILTCSTAPVYRSVLAHEFGHAMGLVDNGLPMVRPHEDGAHPGHSSNQDSVMYWAVETTEILPLLGSSPPDDYDADDRADMQAAGGK